jgi:hypothetical protein
VEFKERKETKFLVWFWFSFEEVEKGKVLKA